MSIQEQLQQLMQQIQEEIAQSGDSQALEAIRLKMLGKKGQLTQMLRHLGELTPEERPQAGQLINQARERFMAYLTEAAQSIDHRERSARMQSETIDVTQPMVHPHLGGLHPVSLVLAEAVDVFTGMGFEVVEGPEVEFDHYNFELLNLPKNHPARDAQDTFYIEENIVLRTHTSPVQARIMTTRKPPIRVICPGRVYRADEVDASHSPVFHQLEGLVIDQDVTMADLKGTLDAFAKRLYGGDIRSRFRPSFFPFTEPSAEYDLLCSNCGGEGCKVCKGSGWVEVLGCGMVNPKVLDLCDIDSKVYRGFAFGVGLDRIAMQRYAISDMRLLFEGDVRFLSQFRG